MASGSNGELYGRNMNKRSLDNGFMPQWKPRKVSAVRDFPPGCGPNSVAINLEAAENNGNGPSVFKPRIVNATLRVGVDCCKIADGDATDIPKFCDTQDSGMDGVKELTMKTRHRGTEFTARVDCELHEAISDPVEGDTAESLNVVVGTLTTMAMEGSLIDAEDFITKIEPLGVGLCNDLESDAFNNMPEDGGQTTVNELSGVEHMELLQNSLVKGKPVLDAGTAIDQVGLSGLSHTSSSPKGLIVSDRVELETTHRPKDKYRRRRVSAVRDFPPLCGTNAPQPTREERQMLTCENDYLDEVKRGMVISRNDSNSEELKEMLKTSECLDWAENVNLKSETTKKSSYDSGREPLKEKLIRSAGTSDIQGAMRANMEARPKSFKESNGGVKDVKLKKPEEKQTVSGSREMTKALHRKRKVGSEGGTRTGKMGKQHSPWQRASIGFTSKSDLMANRTGPSVKKAAPVSSGADGRLVLKNLKHHGAFGHAPETTQNFMSRAVFAGSDEDSKGPIGKEVAVHSPGNSKKMKPTHGILSLVDDTDRKAVHDMVGTPCGAWKKVKVGCNNSNGGKARKQFFSGQHKFKTVAKKSSAKSKFSGGTSMDHKVAQPCVANGSAGALVLADKRGYGHDAYSPDSFKPDGVKAILPPIGPKSSSHGDARKRVRETLRLFHAICRKLLHEEEAKSMHEQQEKSRQPKKGSKRIDLRAANYIKDKGKEVNTSKILGEVPGIQVGDEFQYRVELAVVGIHRLYQNGIDSIKHNGKMSVATSIVASGAYADDMESGDILIYSGQGGNVVEKDKEPEDQKLEKGNLALKNSISAKTPVRVVRGWKVKTADSKKVPIYIYDGLYTVKRYWTEIGSHGKKVFMFELWRNPGQPELAWKELKRSNRSKTRTGVCVNDISGGKEPFPICAVNILSNEKPPPFNYISKMMYPDWYHPISPKGCDCTGRCSDSRKCQCATKNGGEIPYNRNGAMVEIKPLVYECGPSCKCPPSCYNRVSQRGIEFKLEIFKTGSRGWGVRSLNSIPSGSFICEYSGELLEDKEAEKRGDDDEYLFDIGHNFNMPEKHAIIVDYWESGFTIDAARYGNVGRFINHSCSPNLCTQNVVYDHDDKRMPHVMLFAAENIPPLQELTYHYNYKVGQVYDSYGNVKTKNCFCGAPECSGRMY
ncbi:LOW QUALITY PROTEIN: uncharacterized protein LOC142517963 [Primulina tabacum]|uniref:LOW QUALITY PROTEIN: uncharacterized protein LOC142517963 n=1 Tax=Primulina tabacum TaxID=48773 RepID=UPI003F5A1786